MNKSKLLCTGSLLSALCLSSATAFAAGGNAPKTEAKPANILFFISDQLSWQALETFGNPKGSTPTVDSLGRNGVAFSKTYTACPLSMPARAALWTGQYPHVTGVESNQREWTNAVPPESMPTMGSIFSANGYECVHFGKRHDTGTLRGFKCEEDKMIKVEDEHEGYPLTVDSYKDVYATRKSVEYIKGTKGMEQPFFCVVDLNNPHNICAYIGAHRGEHENPEYIGDVPQLPANFDDIYAAERPHPVQYLCCTHVRQSQTVGWNGENFQHYLSAYYYYANRMDRDVKAVLEALEQSGNAENTLIVFMADHGEGMAAKQMVTKQGTPYDQTTRVPLIFAGKGVKKAKSTIDKPLVSVSIDMIPTLCDYAGIETPESLPGESLMGWISGKQRRDKRDYICTEWVTEWGYTVSPYRMIRSHDFKYVKYLEDSAEELFDMNNDPLEMINLAKDKKYAKILSRHRDYLAEYVDETNDNFYSREVYWDPKVAKHPVGYQCHEGPIAPQINLK